MVKQKTSIEEKLTGLPNFIQNTEKIRQNWQKVGVHMVYTHSLSLSFSLSLSLFYTHAHRERERERGEKVGVEEKKVKLQSFKVFFPTRRSLCRYNKHRSSGHEKLRSVWSFEERKLHWYVQIMKDPCSYDSELSK